MFFLLTCSSIYNVFDTSSCCAGLFNTAINTYIATEMCHLLEGILSHLQDDMILFKTLHFIGFCDTALLFKHLSNVFTQSNES